MKDWGGGGVSDSFFRSWIDCVNGWKLEGGEIGNGMAEWVFIT
jgi:hypothetical protein